MLFTLGLLLLLTPFPSLQLTTAERRNSTGNDATKPSAPFIPSKPKTTAALAKQTIRPTLKPNTVNQTVLPPPAATKTKASPVIQTTQSPTVKATPATGTITNKDKHTVSVNKSASVVRTGKDKPAPTGAPNLHSASTRSASASGGKTTKDKLQPEVNQTVSMKAHSTSDGTAAKDKPAPTLLQNVQSTSPKSAPASGAKVAKNKSTASVNQTAVAKSPSISDVKVSKVKQAATVVQTDTAGGSTAEKEKVTSAVNQTTVNKAPATKEKSAPTQPINVVIKEGCGSSNTKEQEVRLKPGAPLVMTHKISLLPGGCAGGCEAEMTALKERLTRLEREMSSLKEKCMILS